MLNSDTQAVQKCAVRVVPEGKRDHNSAVIPIVQYRDRPGAGLLFTPICVTRLKRNERGIWSGKQMDLQD